MSKDLLLEIGTEEIPAGYILPALEQLKANTKQIFSDYRIKYKNVKVFATPRRLGMILTGVDEIQKDATNEVVGPPKKAAYDTNGNPTNAAIGFAKSQEVQVSDLKIKIMPKGEYIYIVKIQKGLNVEKILPELFKSLIMSLSWQKSMRWESDFKFARPIRWILSIYGKKVVKFQIAGVISGNKTFGHRVLKPNPCIVSDPNKYETVLKKNFVIADYEERRDLIIKEVKKTAVKVRGIPGLNERLTEEVANTAEYPSAMLGEFDAEYLKLPEELLIEVMEKDQRYFTVVDKNKKLMPYFIAVKNGTKEFGNVFIDGNQRVLKARFEDAKFFFDEDKKTTLENKAEKLKTVSYQEQLGNLKDKTERLTILAEKTGGIFKLPDLDDLKRAILLCKADLVSGMVKEFTGLQGVMGREYALIDGEKEEVAFAIYEHYLPRFLNDELPKTSTGTVLSILDKIDTIAGCFSVGLMPTGSQDPYGLRRSSLGIISIILKNKIDISITDIITKSFETYSGKLNIDGPKVLKEIMEFFKGRIESILLDKKVRYDVVNAVLATDCSNFFVTFERAKKVNELSKQPGFNEIVTAFSRVINILPKGMGEQDIKEELLKEEAEKGFFNIFKTNETKFLVLINNQDFAGAFNLLAGFTGNINQFFDKILVMDKDETIKNNRLALLQYINSFFIKIADFSKITVKSA